MSTETPEQKKDRIGRVRRAAAHARWKTEKNLPPTGAEIVIDGMRVTANPSLQPGSNTWIARVYRKWILIHLSEHSSLEEACEAGKRVCAEIGAAR